MNGDLDIAMPYQHLHYALTLCLSRKLTVRDLPINVFSHSGYSCFHPSARPPMARS